MDTFRKQGVKMKNTQILSILMLNLLLLLVFTLISSVACMCTITRSFDLVIENQSNQALIIYVDDYKVGEVNPREHITYEVYEGGYYQVIAKNSQDEEIYSREFAFQELYESDWKVIIPPPE